MSIPAALILAYGTLLLGYFMGWVACDLNKDR